MKSRKELIIVGAGGMAQELHHYISEDLRSGQISDLCLKGVLDDSPDIFYATSGISEPYLGSIKDYLAAPNEVLLIAIGSAQARYRISKELSLKGAKFFTYIHPSCVVAPSAFVGEGAIVCPNSIINSGAVVGNQTLINVFCSVGHGAVIGESSVLSPYAALNGDAKIGARCFLGTRSTVFPKVTVGDNCVIDSHSFAKSDVPSSHLVSCRPNYVVIKNRLI